jgi:hypothetical protein
VQQHLAGLGNRDMACRPNPTQIRKIRETQQRAIIGGIARSMDFCAPVVAAAKALAHQAPKWPL